MKAKERLRKILFSLERDYGGIYPLKRLSALDQLIFLILSYGVSKKNSLEAFKRLKKDFIDWNEVRVCDEWEVQRIFKDLIDVDPQKKVHITKTFLRDLFLSKNQVRLDFLKDMDFPQVRRFSSSFKYIEYPVIVGVYLFQKENPDFILDNNICRLLSRLGFIKRKASITATKNVLARLLLPNDYADFHYLFLNHSAKICISKGYDCSLCRINSLCPSSKVRS